MTNKDKINLIVKEFLYGIGFGIVGAIIISIIISIIFKPNLLFTSIWYAFIGGYLGIILGVSIVGFYFLKKNNNLNQFIIAFGTCIFGLLTGLSVIYLIVFFDNYGFKISHGLINFFAISLPLIGAIIGQNLILIYNPFDLE